MRQATYARSASLPVVSAERNGSPRRTGKHMKLGIIILLSACAVFVIGYFTASKWAIRHETLTFYDPARNDRRVAVDVAVRRDKEMRANAGMITLPVAILSHGNTV